MTNQTTQSQFFAGQQISGSSAAKSRRFYYDGQLFEDPGSEYTPQDILNFLASTYPELRNGSWTSRSLPDGSEEITFHKVTGEKGAAGEAKTPATQPMNWSARVVLGAGGYAVVYKINDLALKVGHIEPDEVEAQRYFAAQGLALPVLHYDQYVDLPPVIGREICPEHGLRRDILPPGQGCTCGEPQSMLLMPLADSDLSNVNPLDVRAFIAGFARDCERQSGRLWDTRPANVARYQGRLVALDFGQPP